MLRSSRDVRMVVVLAMLSLAAGAAARIDANWTNGAGGNWNLGTNWSTNPMIPNAAADTATIGLITGAAYTVTLNSAVSLAALTLNSADALLSHSAGALNMNGGTITLTSGNYRLTGGTISNATITGAGLTTFGSSGVLANCTLDTNVSLINSYELRVNGGLTINSGRTVAFNHGGSPTIFDFLGSGNQTLAGGGEVVFNGTGGSTGIIRANGGTLVIGAGITVRSGTQGANVGQSGLISNHGTVAARTNAKTVTVTAVTNNATGILEATNGGTLTMAGAWSNAGTFLLDNNPASALNLGGSFGTASVTGARFDRSGGAVNITGTLTNTGNTLTLDAATGSFNFSGGTITGGTIATPGSLASLNAGAGSGTLSGGVTLDTNFTLTNNYDLRINGGLTVNTGRTVSINPGGSITVLDFLGSGEQTLTGGGEVVFSGVGVATGFVRANAGTLVIDAGMAVRSGTQGGNIGHLGALTNKGIISSQTAARTITVSGTTVVNEGTMIAADGATLTFDRAGGLSSNSGADLLARTGGTLRFTTGMNAPNNGGFDLELNSASPTVGYGRIAVTGAATISGSDIDLIFAGGFTPDWGDAFTILSFDALVGDMSSLALPSLSDPSLLWWREQTATSYTVGVRHIADTNHDNTVNFVDLNRVLTTFGQVGIGLVGDANEDGMVDFVDLNFVLTLFGQNAPLNPIPAPGAAFLLGFAALTWRRRRETYDSLRTVSAAGR